MRVCASIIACSLAIGSRRPATASGVAIGDGLGAPRMSPTPRSAKYGATHGCHRLPGWRKCPPFVIVIAFCHRLRRRRWGCDTSRPRNQMQIPPIQWMINQPNRRRWDAIHIYIDTNIEKWNPHGVGAIAIGSDARLRNPKSLGTADISGWRGRNQEYSVIFAPWNI